MLVEFNARLSTCCGRASIAMNTLCVCVANTQIVRPDWRFLFVVVGAVDCTHD